MFAVIDNFVYLFGGFFGTNVDPADPARYNILRIDLIANEQKYSKPFPALQDMAHSAFILIDNLWLFNGGEIQNKSVPLNIFFGTYLHSLYHITISHHHPISSIQLHLHVLGSVQCTHHKQQCPQFLRLCLTHDDESPQ
jgi:hypothetical protein